MKKRITWKNILRYITGYSRHIRYIIQQQATVINLLPEYKTEQFKERLDLAKEECIRSGKCVACGCDTPALFWIEEECEGGCYPPMLSKVEWERKHYK